MSRITHYPKYNPYPRDRRPPDTTCLPTLQRPGEVPGLLVPADERPALGQRRVGREDVAAVAGGGVVLAGDVAEAEDVAVALGGRGAVHGFLAKDD